MTDKRIKAEPEEKGHLSGVSRKQRDGFQSITTPALGPTQQGQASAGTTQVYLGSKYSQRRQNSVWMDNCRTGIEIFWN